MRKFLLSLLAFAGVSAIGAAVLNVGSPQLSSQANELLQSSSLPAAVAGDAASMKIESVPDYSAATIAGGGASLRADAVWGEWEELCYASFPQDVFDFISARFAQHGIVMPEFAQPFQVVERKASDGTAQLCFKNVFNNVDVIINLLADGSFICDAPTGVAIPDASSDWFEDFHLFMRGYYLEGAHKLAVSSLFLLVCDGMGYGFGSADIILGEAPEFTFYPNNTVVFVPSNQTSATIEVTRSPEVAFYRVVSRESGKMTLSELMQIIAAKPGDSYDGLYRDVTEDSFTIEPEHLQTNVYLIPYDSDGNAIDSYTTCYIYYNKPLEGSWRSIGSGVLRDGYIYRGVATQPDGSSAGVETSVELEVREDNENIIRVKNPYTPSHPMADELSFVDTEDDFYIVFDATDPSRVVIDKTMTGIQNLLLVGTEIQNYVDMTPDEKDQRYGHQWGKFADRRIVMPREAFGYIPDWDFPTFVLELPGYVDYDIAVSSFSRDADGNAVAVISGIAPSVESVSYAMVPSDDFIANRYFVERYVERFADGSDDRCVVRTAQTEGNFEMTVTVPASEIPSGRYYFVAVSRDAQGACHHAAASADGISVVPPLSEWVDAGHVKVTDSAPLAAFAGKWQAEMIVELKECPGISGLYFIPDYYRKWAEATGFAEYYNDDDAEPYIINATDVSYVFITSNPDGSPVNRAMKTGLNVNQAYSTVCLMNFSDYIDDTFLRGGNVAYRERPDGSKEYVSIDFYQGPLCCAVYDNGGGLVGISQGETMFNLNYDPSTDMSNVESWYDLGRVTVTENVALSLSSSETSVFKASIRQAPFDEDLYALVDLYRDMDHPTYGRLDYTPSKPLFVKIGSDDQVWLSTHYSGDLGSGEAIWSTGLSDANGEISVCLMANAIRMGLLSGDSDAREEYYYGTYRDGELILDECLWAYFNNGSIQPAINSTFRIRLRSSDVDSVNVAADDDAPVEYYNLQGVRVANPSGGIFIRRQGDSATKVYVK